MSSFSRTQIALKALHQLGIKQTGLYGLYQLGLRTGHYQRSLSAALGRLENQNLLGQLNIHWCLPEFPAPQSLLSIVGAEAGALYEEADEILHGKVRLFGGQPVKLELTFPAGLEDWTHFESGNNLDGKDIKFVWEPARLGWACKLAMVYHLTKDERYANAFWDYIDEFISANPPYKGPHWSSAQEVAIRLIVLSFATQAFAQSDHSTPEKKAWLAKSIAIHAERIPPTMVYARSQNNNHLVTEALGLYTASALLSNHPLAPRWHKLGKKWLNYAFMTQISPDGTYTQHSTNYHRLMLQCALWATLLQKHVFRDEPFPTQVMTRLEAATRWLWKLVDPGTGHVPNLGHNDGAYILPLSVCPYADFRPVLYAASRVFLQVNLSPGGAWEDMSAWLSLTGEPVKSKLTLNDARIGQLQDSRRQPPHILVNHKNHSWAAFRVVKFHSRPAHADQLHLDLWWRGYNLAQDAGTYLYNAPPPWDNSLTSAFVHNTVTIDGQEFMHKASRFLYLDWAQGEILDGKASQVRACERMTSRHDGYRKLGLSHTRIVTTCEDGRWEVADILQGNSRRSHTARLHWLLPDWPYEIKGPLTTSGFISYDFDLQSPRGLIRLRLHVLSKAKQALDSVCIQVARAGMLLAGKGSVLPITGWTSPTYGDKMPALACILETTQEIPIELKSEWVLPNEC